MLTQLLNGIDVLETLFSSDKDMIEHVVMNTLFFEKEIVEKQSKKLLQQIEQKEAVPVRYNSNGHFFIQHAVKKTTPRFKKKEEAVRFTKDKEKSIYQKETGLRIYFDSDGNYETKKTILEYTQQRVSWGENSTIVNYTIAHIWGETDNPLYFNLMWNYCLIPSHCSYLTDKGDDTHEVVKRIKDLIKAISIELYHPQQLMLPHAVIKDEIPSEEVLAEARQLIKEHKIKFVPVNNSPR